MEEEVGEEQWDGRRKGGGRGSREKLEKEEQEEE